jgi:hypothetical protein
MKQVIIMATSMDRDALDKAPALNVGVAALMMTSIYN